MNLATGVAYVDGRAVGEGSRRGRITCTDRLRAKGEGQHGLRQAAKPQSSIARLWLVCFIWAPMTAPMTCHLCTCALVIYCDSAMYQLTLTLTLH